MKIINELPEGVIMAHRVGEEYFYSNGKIFPFKLVPRGLSNVDLCAPLFVTCENDIFTVSKTKICVKKDVISFRYKPLFSFFFNSFDELETDKGSILTNIDNCIDQLWEAQNIMLLWETLIAKLLKAEHGKEVYNFLFFKSNYNNRDLLKISFFIFFFNLHKQFSVIVEKKLLEILIPDMFDVFHNTSKENGFKLTSNFIEVCSFMNDKVSFRQVPDVMISVLELLEWSDQQTICKMLEVICSLNINLEVFLVKINRINKDVRKKVTFREVLNYFFYKYFNTMEVNSTISIYLDYMVDYINMATFQNAIERNEDVPYLPKQNLKEAHDNLARKNVNSKEEILLNLKYQEDFNRQTESYTYLEWDTSAGLNEYQFVCPHNITDLIDESIHMHNCVKSYIAKVAQGKSQIMFLRKNYKPHVTIEVQKGTIIQALGECNNSLTELQGKIVTEWALEKGLKYRN